MSAPPSRRSLWWNSWLQLGLVLGILLLVNTLSSRHFLRLDVTEDRLHDLSDASRQIIARLERPLQVKVWFSTDLEAPYHNHREEVLSKLETLRAWSGGRLQLEVVDPSEDAELQQEAASLGVQPVPYRFRSEQRAELRQVYMGLAMIYGERQGALPLIQDLESLEFELMRLIKRLLEAQQPKVLGFVTGHQEVNLLETGGPVETLRAQLSEDFVLREVPLGGAQGVPEEVDLLWLVGPRGRLDPRSLYQLDQYLMEGRPLAIFLNNFHPDLRSLRILDLQHGLEPLLGAYGVLLRRDLILDRKSNGILTLPVRQGGRVLQAPINHPLVPMTQALEEHPMLRGVDELLLPFASSIDLLPEEERDPEIRYEVLVRSEEEAARSRSLVSIDPSQLAQPSEGEEPGAWPLVLLAQGTFTSPFADQAPPPPTLGTPQPAVDLPPIPRSAPARLLVASSADLIANNLTLMRNLADWMAQDEELISIRSKRARVRPLERLEGGSLRWLRAVNLLAPAALLLGFGFLRRRLRRRS